MEFEDSSFDAVVDKGLIYNYNHLLKFIFPLN